MRVIDAIHLELDKADIKALEDGKSIALKCNFINVSMMIFVSTTKGLKETEK